ncbi:hypothetical protein [Nocardia sp. XZ_19_385]|uniref:hypothetical protein n=1 Tax=Nocardia sp. XZ_19_385 TaxID=2769488 RepID=UPI00188F9AF7|nr:hypothetical protein [Nocardia sp. XZ_19_385]
MSSSTTVLSHSFDGIFYRIQTTSFDVQYIISTDEEPETVENVDVEVRLPDGSRWSATMFTVAEIVRLMARWSETGECVSGSYFWCGDGVIVREPGVSSMTAVLIGLHDDENALTNVLQRLDED